MVPEVVKYRIWALALRQNPQTATYAPRVSSTTASGSDTFPTTYNLLRVTYRPSTLDELALVGATLADQYAVWVICQVDLDQAGAPTPQLTYELTINGATWVIEKVDSVSMNQAYECLSRLSR